MRKLIFVLTHDYWHHSDSMGPLVKGVFGGERTEEYEVLYTTDPKELLCCAPDLFLSFKDPVENDQIPTPVWCDEEWTADFLEKTKNGMGVILMHAALTDLPEGHEMLTNIVKSNFIMHPAPCEVSLVPVAEHPVWEGVEAFTFPEMEEHYVMEFLGQAKTTLLGNTESVNGTQPGVWAHEYGRGRVCCITPAHTAGNLTYSPFVRLVRNAADWCLKEGN